MVWLLYVRWHYRPGGSHGYDDPIVGVMGMDFTMYYFYYLVVGSFTECQDTQYDGFVAHYIIVICVKSHITVCLVLAHFGQPRATIFHITAGGIHIHVDLNKLNVYCLLH